MPPSLALSLGGLSFAPEEELLGLVEDETLPDPWVILKLVAPWQDVARRV